MVGLWTRHVHTAREESIAGDDGKHASLGGIPVCLESAVVRLAAGGEIRQTHLQMVTASILDGLAVGDGRADANAFREQVGALLAMTYKHAHAGKQKEKSRFHSVHK